MRARSHKSSTRQRSRDGPDHAAPQQSAHGSIQSNGWEQSSPASETCESVNSSVSCARAGREMPSFFIFEVKVVRFSRGLAAAPLGPPITQAVARSAFKIRVRCELINMPSAHGTVAWFLADAAGGVGVAGPLEESYIKALSS